MWARRGKLRVLLEHNRSTYKGSGEAGHERCGLGAHGVGVGDLRRLSRHSRGHDFTCPGPGHAAIKLY